MNLYLDTHAVVWLHAGLLERFTDRGLKLLENETLLVSPMVALELQYLYEIKRIRFSSSEIMEYLETVLELNICKLPHYRVVLESLNLSWTRDPFDRLIVAQCIAGSGRLLTKDEVITANFGHVLW